ncbi:hypothetical protein [Kangiella aquimarina]|uniref:Uncharacterized protein n=1 Tax=Kangiella aquimarina TaxID=261965 RepID=A0ABZ0X531_9GAMM|nr:hypothetical protein [Kangiella aquimarina]WQG85488.1 hypothetical protein SR900_01080 [Kangiella aquimarina]
MNNAELKKEISSIAGDLLDYQSLVNALKETGDQATTEGGDITTCDWGPRASALHSGANESFSRIYEKLEAIEAKLN